LCHPDREPSTLSVMVWDFDPPQNPIISPKALLINQFMWSRRPSLQNSVIGRAMHAG
jgi:hypothetical protein